MNSQWFLFICLLVICWLQTANSVAQEERNRSNAPPVIGFSANQIIKWCDSNGNVVKFASGNVQIAGLEPCGKVSKERTCNPNNKQECLITNRNVVLQDSVGTTKNITRLGMGVNGVEGLTLTEQIKVKKELGKKGFIGEVKYRLSRLFSWDKIIRKLGFSDWIPNPQRFNGERALGKLVEKFADKNPQLKQGLELMKNTMPALSKNFQDISKGKRSRRTSCRRR